MQHNALKNAVKCINISSGNKRAVTHLCTSLLFDSNSIKWVNKKETSDFDVAMGIYIGADMFDLIGIYLMFS